MSTQEQQQHIGQTLCKRLQIYFKVSLPKNNLPKTSSLQKLVKRCVVVTITFAMVICLAYTAGLMTGSRMKHTARIQCINSSKPPAIVWYAADMTWTWIRFNRHISCYTPSSVLQCDVFRRESQPEDPEAYLFYASYLGRFPLPRNTQTIWGLMHDESPLTRVMFMYDNALHLFNFSATYSRYSDVPFPLMAMKGLKAVTSAQYFINTAKKNELLLRIAPVLFMQSDCNTGTNRDEYVEELMKYIAIDSYGACLHNKNLTLGDKYINVDGNFAFRYHLYGDEILKLIAGYKFMVTIENGVCNDYVSEKLWRALELGVVPIYFGSPLVRDWLPNNKSAILVEDYPTPELLSRHLRYLLTNDTAYEEYLEHKIFGAITNDKLVGEITARPYQNDIKATVNKFECFVCEKLHEGKSSVHVVTRKHYDCPLPTSVVTLSVNLNSTWLEAIRYAKYQVAHLYEEMSSADRTQRRSNTSWSWTD